MVSSEVCGYEHSKFLVRCARRLGSERCKDRHDPPIADPGGQTPDARVWIDAHEYLDAHIYDDARVYMDAHVYNDAPIPRLCVNASETVSSGHESLEVTVTCQDTTDAGAAHITLRCVTVGADAGMVFEETIPFTLVCGTYGNPANNFFDNLDVPANCGPLLATKISTATFDLDCD